MITDRRVIVAIVCFVALAVGGVSDAASAPWSGYRIAPAPTADGGFMGARATGGQVVYRIDADARGIHTRYRPLVRVAGGGRRAARAAWILSAYGAVRLADQAAAVDVATYALLSGKGLDGRRARARLRSTGRPQVIAALARDLLGRSKRLSGPYSVSVSAPPADAGAALQVRVRVTSAAGWPLAGVPVDLSLGGHNTGSSTSPTGWVSSSFPAEPVGVHELGVTASRLPDWRLSVRQPVHRKASRVAVAGRLAKVTSRGLVTVRATPSVHLAWPAAIGWVKGPLVASFALSGSEGAAPRTATLSLFGPFPQESDPVCIGTPLAQVTTTVTGDGSYTAPAVPVAEQGLYFWLAHIAASPLNAEAVECGGATLFHP
jgi:hypothetical protein